MHISSSEFIISAAKPEQFPKRPIPHFVFAGRSNVGKSSLLNKLLGRKNLAKTSSKPGKTRLINFFLINDQFYFVDLPGYGFAKVSKKERQDWQRLIEAYFEKAGSIGMVFSLVDSRHDPSPLDRDLQEWLGFSKLPFMVLLTKADKLSRGKAKSQEMQHSRILKLPKESLVLTSAETGLGMKLIWDQISNQLEQYKEWDRTQNEHC